MWRSPSQWTMISIPAARANATSTSSSVAMPVEIREVGCTVARSVVAVITAPSHAAAAPRGASTSSHGASRSTRTSIVVSFVARRRSARRGAGGGAAGGSGPAAGGAHPWSAAPPPLPSASRAARKARANDLKHDSRMWCALSPRTRRSDRSAPSAAASASQNAGVSAVRKRPIHLRPAAASPANRPYGSRRTAHAPRRSAGGRRSITASANASSSGQQKVAAAAAAGAAAAAATSSTTRRSARPSAVPHATKMSRSCGRPATPVA